MAGSETRAGEEPGSHREAGGFLRGCSGLKWAAQSSGQLGLQTQEAR